ncbi:MAG: DNA-3-methyladenine glycosylase I [Kineosporiaceae bacterium]|nr:DNA-3-methyladenine glycosylase I [Kineosporiaceae bacterium]
MNAALVIGDDGLARCAWGTSTPDYLDYHDREWGRPVRGESALYERFTLEAFQSGLSWLTILRKREGFRRAFAGFDPDQVAAFTDADLDRLLGDAAIVRNRAKIQATIANAAAVVALREQGGLEALVWSFAEPAGRPAPQSLAEVPARTPESTALAKALRRAGFVFVGPTTAYAAMQACGLVNDHLEGCWSRPEVAAAAGRATP